MSQKLDDMARELNETQRKVAANVNSLTARVLPFGNDSGTRIDSAKRTFSLATSIITLLRQFQKIRKQQRKRAQANK